MVGWCTKWVTNHNGAVCSTENSANLQCLYFTAILALVGKVVWALHSVRRCINTITCFKNHTTLLTNCRYLVFLLCILCWPVSQRRTTKGACTIAEENCAKRLLWLVFVRYTWFSSVLPSCYFVLWRHCLVRLFYFFFFFPSPFQSMPIYIFHCNRNHVVETINKTFKAHVICLSCGYEPYEADRQCSQESTNEMKNGRKIDF